MIGQMQDAPLLVSSLISHAAKYHGQTEIVSRRLEGDLHRYTYRDCERRARRLADALLRLGVQPGDRIATLAWNGYRHLEIYYGVSGMGAVCHTINPRLFHQHLVHIINQAEDRLVFFDRSFSDLVERIAPQCPCVQSWILLSDEASMPGGSVLSLLCYERLLADSTDDFVWPVFEENTASSLCYTSGTTGFPKGVLYSHRSTVLHAFATSLPDGFQLSARDVVMPVVPMFHVNAWGLPYSAAMVGAKLVLPGAQLDGASLYELLEREGVSFSAGVPTIWSGLLHHVTSAGLAFATFKRTVIGGSAVPPAMMQTLRELGVAAVHAWGMTEMSPLGTVGTLLARHDVASETTDAARHAVLEKQGRPGYGVDLRILDAQGRELPWDGVQFGDLWVRGPWIVERYYGEPQSALVDGWFSTGDVATLDPDGYMHVVDRTRDVIKSGGEWISSIELENIASSFPGVQLAACIAVPHPKWHERPLLLIRQQAGAQISERALLNSFKDKVPKWWIPDEVIFVNEIPLTATGKVQKLLLREQFKRHMWATNA